MFQVRSRVRFGSQPVLQVEPRLGRPLEAGVFRRGSGSLLLRADDSVGLDFEPVAAADILETGERGVLGHLGDSRLVVLADMRPDDRFVLPPDGARERDPHDRLLHVGEADGGERDLHFQHPAVLGHPGLGGEDAVPAPVVEHQALVRKDRVVLGPERTHLEDVAVPAVVVGVEPDDHPVVLVDAAAPVQDGAADAVRLRIEEREAEVEGVLVVGDPHFGALAGRGAVHRVALAEAGDRRDLGPEWFVQNSVHARRGLDADRPRLAVLGARRGPEHHNGKEQGSRCTPKAEGRADQPDPPAISCTSTSQSGDQARCGWSARRASAASMFSACTIE